MIDALPLDLFGEDEPEDTNAPGALSTATCRWCAAAIALDATTCEARILPSEPPAPILHDGICQWCDAMIAPDVAACPACGWDARGDNQVEMPGITTPLSEAQIRALYGGDDPEPATGDTIAIDIAAEIIGMILPRG